MTTACALAAILATVSCASSSGPRPTLQVDVAQFIARINQWAPAEREASEAISQVLRSHFLNADLVTSIADRMLPAIDTHLAAIETYSPRTSEIGGLHARYAGAWRRLREGFELIREGMRTNDTPSLAKGRRYLEIWSQDLITVADELRDLAETVGISKTNTVSSGAAAWQYGMVSGCPCRG